jgi:hypothetical protein
LFLPRFGGIPELPKEDENGRMHRTLYAFEPWYMKTDRWTRFKTWLGSGGRLHAGGDWGNNGFRYEEVGPPELVNASRKPVVAQANAMAEHVRQGQTASGCPFTNDGEIKWAED